jgi:CubicO group peptidase (beta-lactamase class C family)
MLSGREPRRPGAAGLARTRDTAMNQLNQLLLVLHFLGLALGFSASIANIAMAGLIAAAPPPEKPVLGRFPPIMSRVGSYGLLLLWITGAILVYTRWGGFGALPWQFHAKLTAVVLLTGTVGYLHSLQRRIQQGDAGAMARVQTAGMLTPILALAAVVFAVLTFN